MEGLGLEPERAEYLRELAEEGAALHSHGMPERTICDGLLAALDEVDRLRIHNQSTLDHEFRRGFIDGQIAMREENAERASTETKWFKPFCSCEACIARGA
jgi:hypothetical protein